MSMQELAAQLRSGEIQDQALADFAVEYARAERISRSKKDD
ncbi:hypothetical protein GCM10010174_04000 [Kutzneria viridogrisea]|uniref:Uncharacterized protein n=2 Tax=Kutzneria TaxID=43356 RepID=W5VZ64_9PSEU|nr:hypothetical protein [Kutzneria albida]AHH94193.1 hypothetical protein KALB_819 [Kutzneria albida DSM 43870]MBA8929866.1 hypothetical protein [Kutzneria viridogrisea]